MSQAPSPPTREEGAEERTAEAGIASEAAHLIESVLEYVAVRIQLELHRIEVRGRVLVREVMVIAAAGAVALFGLALLSMGVAWLISDWIGYRAAGPLLVGGFYLLVASVVGLVFAARRGP